MGARPFANMVCRDLGRRAAVGCADLRRTAAASRSFDAYWAALLVLALHIVVALWLLGQAGSGVPSGASPALDVVWIERAPPPPLPQPITPRALNEDEKAPSHSGLTQRASAPPGDPPVNSVASSATGALQAVDLRLRERI